MVFAGPKKQLGRNRAQSAFQDGRHLGRVVPRVAHDAIRQPLFTRSQRRRGLRGQQLDKAIEADNIHSDKRAVDEVERRHAGLPHRGPSVGHTRLPQRAVDRRRGDRVQPRDIDSRRTAVVALMAKPIVERHERLPKRSRFARDRMDGVGALRSQVWTARYPSNSRTTRPWTSVNRKSRPW